MDKELQVELKNKAALSAKELIKKKTLIQQKFAKNILISIESIGKMEFRVPTYYDISDAQVYGDGSAEDEYLIYVTAIAPNLREQELMQAFEVSSPEELVRKLFLPGEIKLIATELVKAAGYDDKKVKVIKDIKNE